MTPAQYLKFKKHRFTIKRLAWISGYSATGLWKMYNRDPALIDEIIELHKEELSK